ncbi:MAG: FAD-binding oxidoreductase [Thermomicrobiales bacterium]
MVQELTVAGVDWSGLKQAVRGGVILPGDPRYDEARQVWNGMIDRRPAAIVRCRSTADVVAALGFARDQGLPVAIRGGGHNAAGLAIADGGLVIDLTDMDLVRVDAERRLAYAGGGATWGGFDAATQAHGLATTGGAISSTGVGGLTLGGGLGWLMRWLGLACDNLVEMEVVLADGSVVRTSETEYPELFWGLRGGGGNFGIVTEFVFRVYPLDGVYAGLLIHPRPLATAALQHYREATRSVPDKLTAFFGILSAPDGAPIVGYALSYAGDATAGEEAIASFRAFGEPVADLMSAMPYTALQRIMDDTFPAGQQVYWKSHFLVDLSDEVIETMVHHANAAPSPLSKVMLEHLGGAVARVPQDATAFDHRDAEYNLAIIATWTDPAESEANIAWAREFWEAMQPYARGVYVNYLGIGDDAGRVRAAYSPEHFARLAALKRDVDPDNVFRANQNIAPALA